MISDPGFTTMRSSSVGWRLGAALWASLALLGLVDATGASAQTAAAPAAGAVNLNITPKRLVLDRGKRAGTAYIFNQGSTSATFDIALVDRVMTPEGEIKAIEEARADPRLQPVVARLSSAQTLLQATPRRVTLAPGQGQTIRIRTAQPDAGASEFRTHLTVTTVPPRDAGVTPEQAQAAASNQLAFRITSTFGLSIPVIVRPGVPDARGAFENARFEYANVSPDGIAPAKRTPVVRLELKRLGASSLFGNVEVKSGRETLGLIRGLGVYTEIDRRTIQVSLRRAPRAGEQLTITFTDDDAMPGQVVAKTVLPTP